MMLVSDNFPARLPLASFEIESSWRTRKHIKGDLVNLLELQPALGVIVLCGDDATSLLGSWYSAGSRLEVWDESNVEALLSDPTKAAGLLVTAGADVVEAAGEATAVNASHSGKYWRLSRWLEPATRFF